VNSSGNLINIGKRRVKNKVSKGYYTKLLNTEVAKNNSFVRISLFQYQHLPINLKASLCLVCQKGARKISFVQIK
jgi:hypothetical protein